MWGTVAWGRLPLPVPPLLGVAWEVEHPGHGARAITDGVIAMTGISKDESVDVAALDAAVGKVRAGLPSWVGLPVEEKAGLVHRLRRRVGDESPGMVEDWRVAQGLERNSFWIGDVWLGLVGLPLLIRGLGGDPVPASPPRAPRAARGPCTRTLGGRVTVDVFPASRTDRMLFMGYSGQVGLQAGVTVAEVAAAGEAVSSGEFPDAGAPCCWRPGTSTACRGWMP